MTIPPLLPEHTPARCTCRSFTTYLSVIMLTLVMALAATAVVTYVMPKKFESKAVIQVKPSIRHYRMTEQHSGATEFDVMRAKLTLQLVVQQLNLTALWGKTEDEAIDLLRTMITTHSIRGTDLIEIRVRHTDPEVTRDVAKGVYEAYKKRREDKERLLAEEGLRELEKAVLDQSDVVEEKRKARDNLLRNAPGMIRDDIRKDNGADDTQQEMLDRMREKLAMDRINLKQPMEIVVLHEEPIVAQLPYSPNVSINLALGAGAGLILGLIIALLMKLFQSRCKRCYAWVLGGEYYHFCHENILNLGDILIAGYLHRD